LLTYLLTYLYAACVSSLPRAILNNTAGENRTTDPMTAHNVL